MTVIQQPRRAEMGRHIRRRREELGWSLETLVDRLAAEGLLVGRSTLSRIEQGSVAVNIEVAEGLSRCLGTSVGVLTEVLRTARRRKAIDLTAWTFDGLIDAGKREAVGGSIRNALDYFEAARDWVMLHPEAEQRETKLARGLSLQALAQLRLRNYLLARELNGWVLNLKGVAADVHLQAILIEVMIGYGSRDCARARMAAHTAEQVLDDADPGTRAFGLAVLGNLEVFQEQYQAAIPWFEKARDAYRDQGNEMELARAQVWLGFCLHATGHPQGGRRLAEEGLRLAQAKGFRQVEAVGCRVVGRMRLEQGEPDAARSALETSSRLARRLGLAHDEFLAEYWLWVWSARHGTRTDIGRCVKVMKRLLPLVDREAPEVKEFLASIGQEELAEGRARQ